MHGSMLESLGQPYWETAQGVTLTTATVGIICGILIGITLINIAARKGYTKYIKDPADIPEDFRTGFFRSREEQPEIGKQTTNNGTIDTFAWHLSLILLVTGAGYLIDDFAHAHSIPILTDLSAWVYMLLLMYAIWPLIVHFKLDRHFNAQVKGKITGTISDFIIVAAIVSIPLDMVLAYWKPILVMCVLGLIITPAMIWFGCKICCQTDWLEKCMGPMGMNHGDFITGVLLIKMCDPNMQSDALEDFSLGYTIHNFYALPLFLFIVPYVVARGPVSGAIFCLIQVALMFVLLVICNKIFKRKAA